MQGLTRTRLSMAVAASLTGLTPATAVPAYSAEVVRAASLPSEITQVPYGTLPDGASIDLYRLRNRRGMQADIMTYGGIVTRLTAPDRTGHYDDVVLGFDDLKGYLNGSPYFGALIGRYGNRIAHGRFTLSDQTYQLAINNGPNALHGGIVGFDKVVWRVEHSRVTASGPELSLLYVSRDGEEGYPGALTVRAVYTLTNDNALKLEYTATTDRATVINLTQHSYFNLRGSEKRGDVLGHEVMVHAARFTPVDPTLIPTGELRPVAGTVFDFRKATAIGARIGAADEQIQNAKGYDHNWIIDGHTGTLRTAAVVDEPLTGRRLEVLSDQPGLQFYTGNFLDGSLTGKGGWRYAVHSGFCMEPQHFPDSPNHPGFPSTILTPGKTYHSTIIYRFRTEPYQSARP